MGVGGAGSSGLCLCCLLPFGDLDRSSQKFEGPSHVPCRVCNLHRCVHSRMLGLLVICLLDEGWKVSSGPFKVKFRQL